MNKSRCLTGAVSALLVLATAELAAQQAEVSSGYTEKTAVHGKRFMISAANPHAVRSGHAILKRGGSAIDAAIATQMVLGLVEGQSSGIGGDASLLHWNAAQKKLTAIDGRVVAPAAADPWTTGAVLAFEGLAGVVLASCGGAGLPSSCVKASPVGVQPDVLPAASVAVA